MRPMSSVLKNLFPWKVEGVLSALETIRGRLVRKGGLEPPWVAPPDPKSGASANFATFAFRCLDSRCLVMIIDAFLRRSASEASSVDPGIYVGAFRHQRHPSAGGRPSRTAAVGRPRDREKQRDARFPSCRLRSPACKRKAHSFARRAPASPAATGLSPPQRSGSHRESCRSSEKPATFSANSGEPTPSAHSPRISIRPPGFTMCWAAVRPLMVW